MSTILIIDDDPRNIFALREVLRSRKYQSIAASGFEEAMEVLNQQKDVGAILMDMMMPTIDGYTAIGILKEHEHWKDIPVIAVTAQAMLGDREKCLEAGADGYVSKPVDIDELMGLLSELS